MIVKPYIEYLFAQYVCLSPQTVSGSAVCLCKFHYDLTNSLKFNIQAILQRRGVLNRVKISEYG